MSAPRVTVLTTLYNKGPYVAEALNSVLGGSLTDLELLVVDDGSTDNGPEVVGAMSDPRVRFLPHAVNTGRAAAANRGFDAARGSYIAILDADDIADPERFSKQAAFLDAHPDIGAIGSYARIFGIRERIAEWPLTDEEARGVMLFQDPMLYGSAMFRASVIRDHRLRCREDWRQPGMDYLFLLSVARHTRMANLPEPLTSYRLGEQNFRHGRDLYAVRERICREALRSFGIEATQEELEAHLMLEQLLRSRPTPALVRRLRAWTQRLRMINRSRHLFPEAPFEARLAADWRRWFYILADRDIPSALAHLAAEGGNPARRLLYLLKIRLRRARSHG